MKLKHLLERLEAFLDAKARQRGAEKKQVRKVLERLKIKERKLAAEVKKARNGNVRAALADKLKVVHAQRRKGVAALKAMKKSK